MDDDSLRPLGAVAVVVIVGTFAFGLLVVPRDVSAVQVLAAGALIFFVMFTLVLAGVFFVYSRGTGEQREVWEEAGPRFVGMCLPILFASVSVGTWLRWPGGDYGFWTALALVLTVYGWALLVMMWLANRAIERDD